MIHKLEDPTIYEIQIPCDCHVEIITIQKFDDEYDYYYMSFLASTFYNCQRIRNVIWERIKFAWLVLRKGNYIHQEITLNRSKIMELRDNLNTILDLPKKLAEYSSISGYSGYTGWSMSRTRNRPGG